MCMFTVKTDLSDEITPKQFKGSVLTEMIPTEKQSSMLTVVLLLLHRMEGVLLGDGFSF